MRKKRIFCAFAIVAICLPIILFCCIGCGKKETKITTYNLSATFNETENSLACKQTVEYVNTSENTLDKVCFFLYANAFAEGQTPVSKSYLNKAYPNGESFGNLQFSSVCVEENENKYEIEDEKILTVNLDKELFPQESVVIDMQYSILLANINHRLGYGDNAINFGNFFPIACVYQNGTGFVKNDFVANGDPFYSEIAIFEVEITYPKEFVLASSGTQSSTIEQNEVKTTVCKAEKIRDFAFVLSKKFQVLNKNVDGVSINYFYYDDELASKHLKTAVDAIKTYSELFGKYPYKELSVVKTNFCFGGMEYPNLVMISDNISDDESFNYVIAHEIAHQWWYGVVGNDEYSQAWVDEGLTEFSTALFYENNPDYGMNYDTIIENAGLTYANFVKVYTKINGKVDESMNRNLSEFDTEPEYVNCVYTKGILLFDSLRQSMNDRKFFKVLKDYYKNYSFKNSSSEKLIESFSKSSHINLEPFFTAWLEGKVVLTN